MSDDLDVRYGGAIVVDTAVVRDVGARLVTITASVEAAWGAASRAYALLMGSAACRAWSEFDALGRVGTRWNVLHAEFEKIASRTLLMADAYEVVELRAQAAAVAAGDPALADELRDRADRIAASDGRIGALADRLVTEWSAHRFDGLGAQGLAGTRLGGAFGALLLGVGMAAGLARTGVIPAGTVLRGKADAVTVTPVKTSSPSGPPTSLPEALRRFPTTAGAQVKVERYAMPDGTNRFVAYAKGTQSVGYGGKEPWDMKSNKELYSGETSASYQATIDALKQAGAKEGDRVDIFAHSQAGMIASHLAMGSEFDVRVEVTAGSPVEPTLDDDQLLVQLRHTDDLVSSLAGGGSPGGTGSPDSFTAERVGDPDPGLQDFTLRTHVLESYIETAEMLEESGDPRLDGLDGFWDELGEAEDIESTEYHAERVDAGGDECE